jgi:hypothetical protein
MKTSRLFVISIVIMSACSVAARTWYVAPDGTGDAPTIQAAIDSAAARDTVLLANGTFTGPGNRDIEYFGKAITVRSESGDPQLCVVDCEQAGRGFIFQSIEGPESVLEGITVTHGFTFSEGGALYVGGASGPTIVNCIFAYNSVPVGGEFATGGAVYSLAMYTDLKFVNCTFVGNSGDWGGAMYCFGHFYGPIAVGCVFIDNTATQGGAIGHSAGHEIGEFWDCTFYGNSAGAGGAVRMGMGQASFLRCTFVANSAEIGSAVCCGDPAYVNLDDCVIAGGIGGYAVYCKDVSYSNARLSCCDIWGNAGGDWEGKIRGQLGIRGNFSACPSFCGFTAGDFGLCDESPCLPGNHPDGYDCGLIGAWEQGCSCGPSRLEATTWGGIKSLYR